MRVFFNCTTITLLSLSFLLQTSYGENLQTMFYGGDTICDVKQRLDTGCSINLPKQHSKVQCVLLCVGDQDCIGTSIDSDNRCFKHYECPSINECGIEDADHFYLSKKCDNGGAWVPSQSRCQCVNYWVGESCQEYPGSCPELFDNIKEAGIHHVFLDPDKDGLDLVPVTCHLSPPTYYNMPIMANRGRTDYNLTWDEYRDGVRGQDGELTLWVGLRSWHVISTLGYNTLFVICTVEGLGQMYRRYYNFRVSDESVGFSYSYTSTDDQRDDIFGVLGYNVENCLVNQNIPCSTWDQDRDAVSGANCASMAGSGWWYTDCDNPCNLLGWGTQVWDSKPSHQLMSVLGFDIETQRHRNISILIYATNTH